MAASSAGESGIKRLFQIRVLPSAGADVQLFSDEPIDDAEADYFGFASFARALAEIIDNEETGTPLTIALSAPWGAGKTSVARMIERDLASRVADRSGVHQRIICQFNAWEHDDAPHLGAALAACVARVANRRRPIWQRLVEPLPSAMLEPRQRWGRVILLGLVAAALTAVLVAIPQTRHWAEQFLKPKEAAAGIFGALWLGALVWGVLYKAGRNATRFIDSPGSEAARGAMAEVRGQLGKLIKQATRGGRLVIFVDDLERCRPARAVEVFEVASQLLSHRGVVTVLLADMRSLAAAASAAYQEDSDAGDDDPGIGRRYLEKLVQLELQLPPPAIEDMKLLLAGKKPSGAKEEEEKPEPEAREQVLGPYERVGSWATLSAAGIGFAAWLFAVIEGAGAGDSTALATAVAGVAAGVVGAAGSIWVAVDRWRRRRVVARVRMTLQEHPISSSADTSDSDALVREAAGEEKYEPLAQQVAESLRTVESPEIEAVESFIGRYPPPFPRGAKRMLNHARLLTKIAREREMFGGEPELTPEHLGKWIVIGERWPWFAEEVIEARVAIGTLENPAVPGRIQGSFPTDGAAPRDDVLVELVSSEPKLADVVERLIYFRPAATTTTAAAESDPVPDPVVS